MGLRINQNIAAFNAARNLDRTDKMLSRSLERLSSGYRINRAADDPAGLIISENLRAQVGGLAQAIRNSESATNLIKTAEAAMDETLTQLRSIRDLALDALNTGASDATARAADQTQIESAITTLNRIGNQTQFGTIYLLNGSSGVTGVTNDSNITFVTGTSSTQAGSYTVNITASATQGTFSTNDNLASGLRVQYRAGSSDKVIAAIGAGASVVFKGSLVSYTLGTSQMAITLTNGATGNSIAAILNANSSFASGFYAAISGSRLVVEGKYFGLGFAVSGDASGMSAMGVANGSTALWASTVHNSSAPKLYAAETLTFNGSTTVTISAQSTLSAAVTAINNAMSTANVDVRSSELTASAANGYAVKIYNTAYGSVTNQVVSSLTGARSNLYVGTTTEYMTGQDVAGTVGGESASGSGRTLTVSSGNPTGLQISVTGDTAPTGKVITVTNSSLRFQVGANTGQSVLQSIPDIRANKLGLTATGLLTSAASVSDINVSTVNGATDAIKLVDDAISTMTTLRGNLGSFQANTLESNINSLGVAKENLTAAESAIRDADFGVETVTFTRNQILLQAGTAILVQANAVPQAVLQLLA